jgi:hypothetical protein
VSDDDGRPWDVHVFVHVFSEAFGGLVVARDGQVADLLGPGEVAGTMSVVCRFQMFGLLGSEQPIRMKICIRGWVSVISILMLTCVASEARSGSVMLYAQDMSPFIRGYNHFFFCSGVQYLARSSMLLVSGAWQFIVFWKSVTNLLRQNHEITHLCGPVNPSHDFGAA